MGLHPLWLLSCPGAGGAVVRGGCTTYFRVSRLLQVEQEKQCTHQALLRADTTVRGRRRLSDPTGQPQGPLCTGGASQAHSCRAHKPRARRG